MAETVEGGIYKDATGDGYHDANGKPVSASKVAEANKVKQPAPPLAVRLPRPELATAVPVAKPKE